MRRPRPVVLRCIVHCSVRLTQAITLLAWCRGTCSDRIPSSRPPKMPLSRRQRQHISAAGGLLSVIAAASSQSAVAAGTCSTANTSCPAFLAPHKATSLSLGSDQRHSLSARRKPQPGTCRVPSRKYRSRRICVLMDKQVGEQEEEAGRWSGRPRTTRPLAFLAEAVNAAILEMCVENQGRPLAMAMTDLVERAVEAFVSGEGRSDRGEASYY